MSSIDRIVSWFGDRHFRRIDFSGLEHIIERGPLLFLCNEAKVRKLSDALTLRRLGRAPELIFRFGDPKKPLALVAETLERGGAVAVGYRSTTELESLMLELLGAEARGSFGLGLRLLCVRCQAVEKLLFRSDLWVQIRDFTDWSPWLTRYRDAVASVGFQESQAAKEIRLGLTRQAHANFAEPSVEVQKCQLTINNLVFINRLRVLYSLEIQDRRRLLFDKEQLLQGSKPMRAWLQKMIEHLLFDTNLYSRQKLMTGSLFFDLEQLGVTRRTFEPENDLRRLFFRLLRQSLLHSLWALTALVGFAHYFPAAWLAGRSGWKNALIANQLLLGTIVATVSQGWVALLYLCFAAGCGIATLAFIENRLSIWDNFALVHRLFKERKNESEIRGGLMKRRWEILESLYAFKDLQYQKSQQGNLQATQR